MQNMLFCQVSGENNNLVVSSAKVKSRVCCFRIDASAIHGTAVLYCGQTETEHSYLPCTVKSSGKTA